MQVGDFSCQLHTRILHLYITLFSSVNLTFLISNRLATLQSPSNSLTEANYRYTRLHTETHHRLQHPFTDCPFFRYPFQAARLTRVFQVGGHPAITFKFKIERQSDRLAVTECAIAQTSDDVLYTRCQGRRD